MKGEEMLIAIIVFLTTMLFFIAVNGSEIRFYSDYERCNKDFDCFRKVIELQQGSNKDG